MKAIKTECRNAGMKVCQAAKLDGTPCQAAAMADSDFCFFHDPAKAEERLEAQSYGGSQNKMKTLPASAPYVRVESSRDVVRLLSETINQVRKGEVDPRVANAIGYLANILVKAIEQGEVEGRIDELEALVKNRKPALDLAMNGIGQ